MDRFLVAPVYLFAGLSAMHWVHIRWQFQQKTLWCGNVISDPFDLLVNFFGPLAGAGLMGVIARRHRQGRRPILPFLALPFFLGTLLALVCENRWLRDYGLEIERIWWLPRF